MEGLKAYLSSEYWDMNLYLYDSSSRKRLDPSIKKKILSLKKTLKDLPPPCEEYLHSRYSGKYDGKHLFRGVDFYNPEKMISFLERHRSKDVVVYPSFTSTTCSLSPELDGNWRSKRVQIEIKHLPLKESKARHIDPFKRKRDEGELLYPPGQKFKVKKVEVIEERERLPDYFRERLYVKWSDLTLQSVLGDRTLDDPDYFWLKPLIKSEVSPDTKIADLKLRFKGGRIAFLNQAEGSLRRQVRDSERTKKMDPTKARIFLEELRE
jgi:hypothetical protein